MTPERDARAFRYGQIVVSISCQGYEDYRPSGAGVAKSVTVIGAGIIGVWQALILARAGHNVRVFERSVMPFADAASQYAGAMIAPFCEAEAAEPIVQSLGLEAAQLWRQYFPGLHENGSLVVAAARDQSELKRFARMTSGHEVVDANRLASLEPELSGRFATALFFKDEAHMTTPDALSGLLGLATDAGADFSFGTALLPMAAIDEADVVVDCRGLAARDSLPELRGVRGERLVLRSRDVRLNRPVRLLHPRMQLYAVPWIQGRILIGATLIESEDTTPMTVRSALELLGMAYSLHPGLGEAEIMEMSAGIRPSFPDNVPRVIVRRGGTLIFANGAYRHGFLLAPKLAQITRDFIEQRELCHPLLHIEN
ncbi:MAG: FAD-dependent oxidoreductase [Hyphomicrobiaceae bacterium]